jgi:hypothetical protein
MSTVTVLRGKFGRKLVLNETFTMVKGFQTTKQGSFITVENDRYEGSSKIKIMVDGIDQIEFTEGTNMTDVVEFKQKATVITETDEDAMNRIATRFAVLDEMSSACIAGNIRAMIVSGPPGVGKSFGVEQQLEKATLFDKIAGNKVRYQIVKGAMTALGLYAQLYKFSDRKNILVFDDCDSVFADDLSLNILKAALDSGKRRKICWNSDSALLRREGIPDSFEFNGTAIFITNLKFSNVKSKKLQDHLEALQSRCHFLDLTIDSERDKMLRIKQVHRDADGGLFTDYDFVNDEGNMVIEFMEQNRAKLREISMRMCMKIADLVKISPANWKSLAASTCMK